MRWVQKSVSMIELPCLSIEESDVDPYHAELTPLGDSNEAQ